MIEKEGNIEVVETEEIRPLSYLNIGKADNLEGILAQMELRGHRFPTGIKKLDEQLSGGIPVGVSILAAKPGIGKTTIALQMAEHISQMGYQTVYICNDMPTEELVAKGISRASYRVAGEKGYAVDEVMNHHKNGLKEQSVFVEACNKYKQRTENLRFVDSSVRCIEDIEITIDNYVKNLQILPIVIIDYIQKVSVRDVQMSNDKERLDYLIEELKRISLTYGLPIIAISTLNRGSYDRPISIESLKESGGLEYNADLIIGLQHKGVGDNAFDLKKAKSKPIWDMELIILKQRLGNSDTSISLFFYPKFNLFPYDEVQKIKPIKRRRS